MKAREPTGAQGHLSTGANCAFQLSRSVLFSTPMFFDALVILAYFAVIIGIGLSQRSKSGSVEGFTLGDRQIAWWAVLASILAAEISAGTFFGAPGQWRPNNYASQ